MDEESNQIAHFTIVSSSEDGGFWRNYELATDTPVTFASLPVHPREGMMRVERRTGQQRPQKTAPSRRVHVVILVIFMLPKFVNS